MSRTKSARFDSASASPMARKPSARFTFTRAASSAASLDALGPVPGSFDLRNNRGGIAVGGEITLHTDHHYVQACQPGTGHDSGVMYRTCSGRRD